MKAYDIVPSAFYPTYGDSPKKRKFRLLFFLDTLITNRKARNHLMDLLLRFYPEADRACRDEAHFFYGTNKTGEVLNPKAISLDLLLTVLDADAVKEGGRLRRLKIGSEGNRKLRALGKNWTFYTHNITEPKNATSIDEKEKAIQRLRDNYHNKTIDWDKLQDRVRIFYDFMNSDQRLKYDQLLGLAQNLAWMKGGKKIYEQRLEEFNANHKGNDPYPENDGRFELVRTMRAYNRTVDGAYFPQRLENFSPYREDHKYRNLIQAERDIISGIEQTEPISRMPLNKAEQLLEYKLNQALDSLDNKLYIFRLTTGIGKSWRIKDLDDVTIAFPTNDLKEELYRERTCPTTAVMTPELPTFSDELLNKKLQRLYTLGLGKQAHRLL
jgi:hypothetical protein